MSPLSIYFGIGVLVVVMQLTLIYAQQKTLMTNDQLRKLRNVFSPLPSEWVPALMFLATASWVATEIVLWPYYCAKELYWSIRDWKTNA